MFKLNEHGYFQNGGADVIVFEDIYPEGHQSGVSIIMHGNRIAANGDVRFEQTPGQWQPVPKQLTREVNKEAGTVITTLKYPDEARHLNGFNPMIYPDFEDDKINIKLKPDAYNIYYQLRGYKHGFFRTGRNKENRLRLFAWACWEEITIVILAPRQS